MCLGPGWHHASGHPAHHLRTTVPCKGRCLCHRCQRYPAPCSRGQTTQRTKGSRATTHSRGDRRFPDQQHQTNAIDAKVMPGITLVGSSPTFYKIPVTAELAQAVEL